MINVYISCVRLWRLRKWLSCNHLTWNWRLLLRFRQSKSSLISRSNWSFSSLLGIHSKTINIHSKYFVHSILSLNLSYLIASPWISLRLYKSCWLCGSFIGWCSFDKSISFQIVRLVLSQLGWWWCMFTSRSQWR